MVRLSVGTELIPCRDAVDPSIPVLAGFWPTLDENGDDFVDFYP